MNKQFKWGELFHTSKNLEKNKTKHPNYKYSRKKNREIIYLKKKCSVDECYAPEPTQVSTFKDQFLVTLNLPKH